MEGDPVVDRLMKPVLDALIRHGQRGEARTDIYNRAYEAVMNSMVVIDTMRKELSKANDRAEAMEKQVYNLRMGMTIILDQVDYTSGACRVNEMVGAVLGTDTIDAVRKILKGGK